jgi:hypothetical protein
MQIFIIKAIPISDSFDHIVDPPSRLGSHCQLQRRKEKKTATAVTTYLILSFVYHLTSVIITVAEFEFTSWRSRRPHAARDAWLSPGKLWSPWGLHQAPYTHTLI